MPGPTWESPIKGYFRPKDITAMKPRKVDLATYNGVKSRAKDIYDQLESGNMPCDDPWPQEKVATFKQWMDAGMPEK